MRFAAAAVVLVLLDGCGGSASEAEHEQQPPVAPLVLSDEAARADAEDRDHVLRRRVARGLASRPALQRLPFEGRHLTIELLEPTTDGLVELRVTSDLPLPQARRAYRRFLASAGDSGRAYRPSFRSPG